MQTPAPVAAKDARQAAQIAGRFRDLQGLRQAVAGVGLLLLSLWEMTLPLSPAGLRSAGVGAELRGLALLVVGFTVIVVAILWVSAWYRRQYGQVERTRTQRRIGVVIGASGVLAFVVPFEIEVSAQTYGQVVPVNLMLFLIALWIIGYWLYIGRSFWHYPLIAGIGFALGIASIAGIPPATFAWHIREATLYFALASIAGGVIDHVILTRSMPRSESPVGLEP